MNSRRFVLAAVVCFLSLLSLGACTTFSPASTPPAALTSRLTPAWIGSAKRVHCGARTIYYRGRATTAPGSDARHWIGAIQGEVLVLDPRIAIVVPSGTFVLRPGGAVNIVGPHTVLTEAPDSWKHLLVP